MLKPLVIFSGKLVPDFLLMIPVWVIPFVLLTETKGLQAKGPDFLTIASYNPENLWDASSENTNTFWQEFLDTLHPDVRNTLPRSIQYSDYSSAQSNWYDISVLKARSRSFVEALIVSGLPDIVGLQEIESASNQGQVFELPYDDSLTLRQKLKLLGYKYILTGFQDRDNPVAVTTAFLSKIPVFPATPVKIDFPQISSSARDIQAIETWISGNRVLIFNGHFKSRRSSAEGRNAMARALKARIDEEQARQPETDIIILGDLNAWYYEDALRILGSTGNERRMVTEIGHVFYNLWFELPSEKRWESSYDGELNGLSHMLISDSLYDFHGLQYIEQSFQVIGHEGAARRLLLGANGEPYRWQIQKYRNSVIHSGKGYSDHLPLVARFRILPPNSEPTQNRRKMSLSQPDQEGNESEQAPLHLVETNPCDPATEHPDITHMSPREILNLSGKCVRIEQPLSEPPLSFKTWGLYEGNFVTVGPADKRAVKTNIGLSMFRSWDWRPNLDDSRVSRDEAYLRPGQWHSRNPHPASNLCYQRAVLQGQGGSLRFVIGRLGYSGGFLNVHIASRESQHIRLENLPPSKQNACPWRFKVNDPEQS